MKKTALSKIARALGTDLDGDGVVEGYRIDSRLVEKGDLFFALRGARVDGHGFLEQAAKSGAVAAVVSQGYQGRSFGMLLVRVADVEKALQRLASVLIEEGRPKMVAVTGSLGKTTCKEFIATLLEKKYRVGKSYLNYNSKLTYPLNLLNRSDEELLVLEMGMSEPGDIARLVSMAAPDVAVLTKVAWVHAANFAGGLSDIAKGKAEIFQDAKTRVCIFDEALYQYPEALVYVGSKEKISFSIRERGNWQIPMSEPHLVHNVLAAIQVAKVMGLSDAEIQERLLHLKQPLMRFEKVEKDGVLWINDAYNASPDSMYAAIRSLPKVEGKTIAVLGRMVEMGEDSEAIHRSVGEFARNYCDALYSLESEAIAEGFGTENVFHDKVALAAALKQQIKSGDVVLVKGSRVLQMEQVLDLCS